MATITQNLGSVMQKIFGPAPVQQTPAQPGPTNNLQTNQPPVQPVNGPGTAPNGVIPPTDPNNPSPSPEDKFKDLWKNEPVDPNKKPDEPQGLTPEQMLQAASKVDFTKVIDKELLAKITAGGEDATTALIQALNRTAQQTYAQTTLVADKLITTQVEKAKEDFAKQVPDLIRRQRVQDGLILENPAFKDPAVAPVVGLIQNQLAEKFPTATADELQKMAIEYFNGAAQKLVKTKTSDKTSTKENTDDDWEDWLAKG